MTRFGADEDAAAAAAARARKKYLAELPPDLSDAELDARERALRARSRVSKSKPSVVGLSPLASAFADLAVDWKRWGPLPDSPIEEIALRALAAAGVGLASAAETSPASSNVLIGLQAPIGPYLVDLILSGESGCIVIECDGAAFHTRALDRPREQRIFGLATVSRIYRLPGWILYHAADLWLGVVAHYDPWVFPNEFATKLQAHVEKCLGSSCWVFAETPGEVEWQVSFGPHTPLDKRSVITVVARPV